MNIEHKTHLEDGRTIFSHVESGDPGILLQDELRRIQPKIDLLHELCGCGQFAEITRTSDGFFLGRAPDDIGFNAFLGRPSEIALRRTATYLPKLSPANRSIAESILSRFDLLRAVLAFDVPKIDLDTRPERHAGGESATDRVLYDMAIEDALDELEAQND